MYCSDFVLTWRNSFFQDALVPAGLQCGVISLSIKKDIYKGYFNQKNTHYKCAAGGEWKEH